jgi:hypothetical protein
MVEVADDILWWLDDEGNRTGDALSIYGGKLAAPMGCRRCGLWSVWRTKITNAKDIYGCQRIATGRNGSIVNKRRHSSNGETITE